MDLDLIEKLFALLDKSTAEELEVTENGVTIRMAKRAQSFARADVPRVTAPAGPSGADAVSDALSFGIIDVRAGMTGTFYRAAAPDSPPYAEIGTRVSDGDRLGLIEAMKTFNPVEAECDGVVTEIAAEDGALVEAGDILFRIEKAPA